MTCKGYGWQQMFVTLTASAKHLRDALSLAGGVKRRAIALRRSLGQDGGREGKSPERKFMTPPQTLAFGCEARAWALVKAERVSPA